jgi:flavodoxin
MKRAIIFYQSKTGTTKYYAKQISAFMQEKQIETYCLPVEKYQESMLQGADYLLLGCWTKGLMVIFQRPDKIWTDFAKNITVPNNVKVALFTTFRIRTGSMFRKMKKCLNHEARLSFPTIESRDGSLSVNDKTILEEFIDN